MGGSERAPIPTSDLIELYLERCGIMRFEADIEPQSRADAMALADIGLIYGEQAKKEIQQWNRERVRHEAS